jgi:UDP-N-acetyl-2-amino-2-deoxyglucuronate dehydrogenase
MWSKLDGAMHTFAVIGVAAGIAGRHLQAIRAAGGRTIAALDLRDSVGFLDNHDIEIPFFTEIDDFQRFLTSRPSAPDFVTICTPNDLHEAHCTLAMELGADVICEKPIVLEPAGLDRLEQIEARTGRRVWTVLQLRLERPLAQLRAEIGAGRVVHDVELTYITARGPWYDRSWKADAKRSGGLVTNIGIHMFDLLGWLFGKLLDQRVVESGARRVTGECTFERARVRWLLSIDGADLPAERRRSHARTLRQIVVDGRVIDFSEPEPKLHDRVYERILAGDGFGIDTARPSIELVHALRQ